MTTMTTPTSSGNRKVAVISGASAGIGAAAARALAAAGFDVVLGARRMDRLEALAQSIGESKARALRLDVDDPESVEAFCESIPRADLLLANAGLGLGLDRVLDSSEERWRQMFETNVLGALRLVQRLTPKLVASGDGHLVVLGSIAGFEIYPGGDGYVASKHALRAMVKTLRLELLGQPVRVTEIAPGMVETEFSLVRFGGDADRARATYRGLTPLTPEDIAEAIAWAATRPAHVNIDEIVIRPRDQATATAVFRRE